MIEVTLVDALNDSINRLQAGQSVADCVAMYPQYAAELESLLAVGGVVSWSQPSVTEAAQAEARGQFRFEQALDQPWGQPHSFAFSPLARVAASLVLVFAFLATGAGIIAEGSLPGDPLYNIKLLTETLRLSLVNNDPATEALFDARRFDEARAIIELGRAAEMTLTGVVEAETSDGMLMDGLLIRTDDARNLTGTIVEVDVISTAQGELVARAIRRRGESVNAPLATESVTEPPAPSNTPLPSATRTPAPTERPTSTQQPTHQPTSERPTASATLVRVDRANDCESPPSGWVRYTIQAGDTLSDLAVRSGDSTGTVATANCIVDTRHIVVGQVIYLPRSPAPTVTDGTDRQHTPVREATATPMPQREQDRLHDRQPQREPTLSDRSGRDQQRR